MQRYGLFYSNTNQLQWSKVHILLTIQRSLASFFRLAESLILSSRRFLGTRTTSLLLFLALKIFRNRKHGLITVGTTTIDL
jgi:hypothetical protein